MFKSAQSVEKLIGELSKLPGIGRKTAQRLTFWILKMKKEDARSLARAIVDVKEKIVRCSICSNITETDPCAICTDPKRDNTTICVVEEANDILAIEKSGEYRGLYHVLQGALSPLDGIGPEQLRFKEFVSRLKDEIKEVIIATNPNVEGEATAVYVSRLVKPLKIRVTRIARGLPIGSDIEYADQNTLTKALQGRQDF
ncbi:MAG: recombination mediator RecR [candidate division Zixibacteria bacterium]|nr:recombination mediator RecR [candidate division Zixibacteria bacterium]MBU1469452.1 recombination mediator RecR [candidate division Zixibacteria bacterium]MBU2624206.1 recombination mediator RecR [candidate division Zixibacteria bacterium]